MNKTISPLDIDVYLAPILAFVISLDSQGVLPKEKYVYALQQLLDAFPDDKKASAYAFYGDMIKILTIKIPNKKWKPSIIDGKKDNKPLDPES